MTPHVRRRDALAPRRLALGLVLALACAGTLLVHAPNARATGGVALDGYERSVMVRINSLRRSRGLPLVSSHVRLLAAADYHSREMAAYRYIGHASATGWAWSARVRTFLRARRVGEVVGVLYRTYGIESRRVLAAWMRSPSHRRVLLTPAWRRIGVARRVRLGRTRLAFYTVDFSTYR